MSILKNLKNNNFKFKHHLGQNFIFDTNLLSAIVDDAQIDKNTTVLEIGTGAGTLTQIIASRAKKVITVEIDNDLISTLEQTFSEYNNIELINNDIMKTSTSDLEKKLGDNYTIVANLPYYITTPIIFKFLEEAQHLNKMVIMVQKEVAERLVASPNSKNYGMITVNINAVADVSIARIVKRNMFVPAPNVDSAIVVIDFNLNKYDIKDLDMFKKVTKSAFAWRRKTLSNNLKTSFGLSSEVINDALNSINHSPKVRGEVLSVKDFVALSQELKKYL